jgi:hypothetical protein
MDKMEELHERMRKIEDRRIEILLEIAEMNRDYDDNITRLNSEYEQLHEEHYRLHMDMIKMKAGS